MDNAENKEIVSYELLWVILQRLAHQLIEDHKTFDDVVLLGIQPRGTLLKSKLCQILTPLIQKEVLHGDLDISFYRDDFRRGEDMLKTYPTTINFSLTDKTVILIDDVLYTGRSVNAALSALLHYGRPRRVQLLCLCNRRFDRQLPIISDYTGIEVDALDNSYIRVNWTENEELGNILLVNKEINK